MLVVCSKSKLKSFLEGDSRGRHAVSRYVSWRERANNSVSFIPLVPSLSLPRSQSIIKKNKERFKVLREY